MIITTLGEAIIAEIEEAQGAYHDFVRNKEEMEKTGGYDKEYHAKANCEAARRGTTGEATAYVLSIGKEAYDMYNKIINKKMDFDVVLKDCKEDIEADLYGIKKSKEKGSCRDLVKDVGKLYEK